MIKFFGKIRQKLLSENKIGKYLKYAIGEIVLVVIGILIAVQINNWNNHKQQVQREIIYLKEIFISLNSDLKNEIKPAIKSLENSVMLYSLLNLNFYESSNKISSDSLRVLITGVSINWHLLLKTVAFENIESIGIDLISNDKLRVKISEMYGFHYKYLIGSQEKYSTHFIEQWQPAWDEVTDNWDKGTIKTIGEMEAIRNNTKFQSKIGSSIWHTKRRIFFLKKAKPKIEQLIVEIEKEINRLKEL